jgi:hypothetical protein
LSVKVNFLNDHFYSDENTGKESSRDRKATPGQPVQDSDSRYVAHIGTKGQPLYDSHIRTTSGQQLRDSHPMTAKEKKPPQD